MTIVYHNDENASAHHRQQQQKMHIFARRTIIDGGRAKSVPLLAINIAALHQNAYYDRGRARTHAAAMRAPAHRNAL